VDPKGLDEQFVHPTDEEFIELQNRFVRVRVVDIKNVDITRIQFDYDLVFAVLFMNANEVVYSRYGSRTPWNHESRVSLEGLKDTMRQVLRSHDPNLRPASAPPDPVLARELLGSPGGCMHCHQVWEGLRNRARRNGDFDPRSLFVYPMPENIGLTLNVDSGNLVDRVTDGSASEQAGVTAGDRIRAIGDHAVHSQADVSWALHNAPESGRLPIRFTRDGRVESATIPLDAGWKETKLSWRASMRDEKLPPQRDANR
jgi:membrane-associated protease RseP (regulator of RpoE activity)